jgi:hypothetical protein
MLFLSLKVLAQTTEVKIDEPMGEKKAPVTHFGLLVNLVNSNIDYGQSSSEMWGRKSSSRGLQAGATFQAGISPRISLVSELYYMRKGGQINAANSPTGSDATLRFHTLEMPVLARVHVGKFHVNAGPSITYNLSGKLKSEVSSTALLFNNSEEGFKRFDAGVQFGGGYKFRIKQKQLVVDLRYSRGLTSLSQSREMHSQYLNLSLQIVNRWKTNPFARR